ncbi:MAG: methylmalonyl-CoA epimerase [Bacillota bacterium]
MQLDHIGIAVTSIKESSRVWTDALGLVLEGTEVVESQKVRVAFLPLGSTRIELLEPTADDSPIARFIETRRPGIHHIAVEVEDIDAAVDRAKGAGLRLLSDAPVEGAHDTRVIFIHPSSTGGVLLELVQRPKEG